MPRRCTLGVVMLALATSASALDQTPPPAPRAGWRGSLLPEQWKPTIPPSPALGVDLPITRDDQVESVSLKEAIALALENNPGIAARRLEPTRQNEGVLGAQSQFDPAFTTQLNYGRSETPNASVLGGATVSVVEDRYANFGLLKRFRTGTEFQLDFLNDRIDSNSSFNALRPQYVPQVGFSVVQPLLRNFGWDFSYLVVRVAEKTADAALAQYEANLADFVLEVIANYWLVVGAREAVEVRRENMNLADRTVRENEARVRVGLAAPVTVLEAQADAKTRESDLIKAENDLAVVRQRLAQLVYFRPAGTFVPRMLEPFEEASPEEVNVDIDRAITMAVTERPEVVASARGVEAQQLNERIAGNSLLPQVDVVGTYGRNGLSGRGGCARVGTTISCTPFTGSASDAYGRLNDFRDYAVGLQVLVPLSNAQARSQYAQSRIALDQAELNHRELLSQVTLQVRQAAADVVASRQRIEVTNTAIALAEENVRNQQKRFEVGMATTKDLLDFQNRLAEARRDGVQAKVDYATAVDRWRRARGELLRHYQIVIEQPGKRSAPWFARF